MLHDIEQISASELIEVLSCVPFQAMTDRLLFCGSLAGGFGNAGSDVDIFVLADRLNLTPFVFYNPKIRRWIDLAFLIPRDIDRLSQRMTMNKNLPGRWGEHQTICLETLDLCHRLFTGVSLNSPPFPSMAWPVLHLEDLIRESAITQLVIARARWHDAAGSRASGDMKQSAYVAEVGLYHASDAVAALLGKPGISSKWRMQRLDQIKPPFQSFAEALQLLFHDRASFDNADQLISLLGEIIFQVTHHLVNGTFSDEIVKTEENRRMEITATGVFSIDHNGIAHTL